MPLLYPYDIAPLETIGEGVEFIRQMFQVIWEKWPLASVLISSMH